MKNLLFCIGFGVVLWSLSASVKGAYWQDLGLKGTPKANALAKSSVREARLLNANHKALKQVLSSPGFQYKKILLPMPDGNWVEYQLEPVKVMAPALAARYPGILTFRGSSTANPKETGRFTLSDGGFNGMLGYQGERIFIQPVSPETYETVMSFRQRDMIMPALWKDKVLNLPHASDVPRLMKSDDTLRTYRLAIAATGEYTQYHGGTVEQGLAALVTLVNRVNQIYLTELAIEFELVADNDSLVYTDAATDPYINDTSDINTTDTAINAVIGAANYDIGHLVGTFGGGLASLGSVCSSAKASGVTGSSVPENDAFSVDFVAHEIGHQFGANHTFNGTASSCGGGNRNASTAYESGSGSTIMAYAGICGSENIQNNSNAYFHAASLAEMQAFVTTGGGSTCGTQQAMTNSSPVANAGADRAIPINTPFVLTGAATDANGDRLSYAWEQFDLGTASSSAATMVDNGDRPIFRSWWPQISQQRYLPRFNDVINQTTVIGEAYPTTDRTMTFRLVVRDGKGGTDVDDMTVTSVASGGAFSVTAPTSSSSWSAGSQTVSWNTAGTASGPVSCANVDVLLSTNGGASFPQTLVSATANDGSVSVTAPSEDSSFARVMVRCSDSIFYALSESFTLGAGSSAVTPQIIGQSDLTLMEDTSLTLLTSHLVVDDVNYPTGYSVSIEEGENYTSSGGSIVPASNYSGVLSVGLRVSNGTTLSEVFSLSILVAPVNDAPVTQDDTAMVEQDSASQLIAVLDNDSDPESDTLSLDSITYSGVGSASISGSQISYTPASGFTGTETLSYTASDIFGASSTATLTITVVEPNNAPTAVNDTLTLSQGSSQQTISPVANDTDPDSGDTLTLVSISYSGSGSASAQNNNVLYTPAASFSGIETISYTIEDRFGTTATGIITITVTATSSGSSGGASWLWLLAGLLIRRRQC